MTQDDIIEWALEANIGDATIEYYKEELEAFAKLVRNDYSNKHAQLWLKRIDEAVKAEREACDQLVNDDSMLSDNDAIRLSRAIRARSEATSRGEA